MDVNVLQIDTTATNGGGCLTLRDHHCHTQDNAIGESSGVLTEGDRLSLLGGCYPVEASTEGPSSERPTRTSEALFRLLVH